MWDIAHQTSETYVPYMVSGDPVRFGGDSVVALFCDEVTPNPANARNALACADAVHAALARRGD